MGRTRKGETRRRFDSPGGLVDEPRRRRAQPVAEVAGVGERLGVKDTLVERLEKRARLSKDEFASVGHDGFARLGHAVLYAGQAPDDLSRRGALDTISSSRHVKVLGHVRAPCRPAVPGQWC